MIKGLIGIPVAILIIATVSLLAISVGSILLILLLAVIAAAVLVFLFDRKLPVLLLVLFMVMGFALEYVPEDFDKRPFVLIAWLIFLSGIYLLAKNDTKSNID